MKKKRRILIMMVSLLLAFCLSRQAMAAELTWENVPGRHNESILLEKSQKRSKDEFRRNSRGEFLAEGVSEIVNQQNGDILISIDTFAYQDVDAIYHTAFVEYWDEKDNDWVQVGYWEFEKHKEEMPNGELSYMTHTFTLTGYPINRYYRVRGLHMVQCGERMEGCSTETDGVYITIKGI